MKWLNSLLAVCLTFVLIAQEKEIIENSVRDKYAFVDINETTFQSKEAFLDFVTTSLGQDVSLRQRKTFVFKGLTITHYDQYYQDYIVKGGTYTIIERAGVATKGIGNLYPMSKMGLLKQVSEISNDHIIKSLQSKLKTSDALSKDRLLDWTLTKKALVVIDKAYPSYSGKYAFCQKYNAVAHDGTNHFNQDVYVDLSTGLIIEHYSNICTHSVPGTVETNYYGKQSVMVDSLDNKRFELNDYTRGDGIITQINNGVILDDNSQNIINDSRDFTFDNIKRGKALGDVHYGASAFFDFLLDRFDWYGLDGEGMELRSFVDESYYVNAYWTGSYANFGIGDCNNYNPLTTLTIVGHEFAHGLTDFTSDLEYKNESGALNESFSDIFGKALEYYKAPQDFSWIIGDKIRTHEDASFIRSMSDPHERRDPKFYGGKYWHSGTSDNGGVHTNSGVLNYWFYLLVEGGEGENERGEYFKVEPIGMDAALDICFLMQSAYLNIGSDYIHAHKSSLSAAELLFGKDSHTYMQLVEAWKAVGIFHGINLVNFAISLEKNENSITLCPGETRFLTVNISNAGDKIIPKDTPITIKFEQSGDPDRLDTLIYLPSALARNQDYLFNTDHLIKNDPKFAGHFKLELASDEDFVLFNNQIIGSLKIGEIEGYQVEIEELREGWFYDPCDSSRDYILIQMINGGCETIYENTQVVFRCNSDQGSFLIEDEKFYRDFEPGDRYTMSADLPYEFGGITQLEVELIIEAFDISSNAVSLILDTFPRINEGYFQGFDTSIDDLPFKITINDFYAQDSIVENNGNNMLAISGVRDHNNIDNCTLPEDFFYENYYQSNIDICVNLSLMEEPTLAFDFMMMHNDNTDLSLPNDNFRTMIQLSQGQFEDHPKVIYDFPINKTYHYKHRFPDKFGGSINIDFLTLTGHDNAHFDFYSRKDMILIDNIHVYDAAKIEVNEEIPDYRVFPNPTLGQLIVRHEAYDQKFELRITDCVGRNIYSKSEVIHQEWVNLSDYPSGFYTLSIFENKILKGVQKIIVQH